MTILTSLLGTKAFGLMVYMWQAAEAASPTPTPGVNHFSPMQMIKSMGAVAIGVVIVLLIMSVYSIAIMVERYLTYTAAKKQSREFAPRAPWGSQRPAINRIRPGAPFPGDGRLPVVGAAEPDLP